MYMLKALSLFAVALPVLTAAKFSYANASNASFAPAPFTAPLAEQIANRAQQYSVGKITFTQIGQASQTLPNTYYMGSDGVSSLLVKSAGKDFSALLNYQGKSYQLTATGVKVVVDEFNKASAPTNDAIDIHGEEVQALNSNLKSSFVESYQMSSRRSTQSLATKPAFYRNFDTHALKKVRVLVSENAIIEELESYGEFNFASLYERIQTGIDLANLAFVTSGVEALQIEASEIVVQRLPKNYTGSVVEQDTNKRIAFPLWGEGDATFQMTALALTQDRADIIYNLGAREHFWNNACGFANMGVNAKKSDPTLYSTDHTYPVAINIKRGCETGRTPVHELGHTIGLHHERDNNGAQIVSGVSAPYAYNFGYTSLEAPAYSIMSYGLACKDAQLSVACARTNLFSSPKVMYGKTAFGVPKPDPDAADAVRFLNDTWALRFSHNIHAMSITPESSGGFTIAWDLKDSDVQSQVLVLSSSGHSRYNYVLDNDAVYNHDKLEIPLNASQKSYTFSPQNMLDLGLDIDQFDTASIFTGHVNQYDDIIPNLHAQLHAGTSLSMGQDTPSPAIIIEGDNILAPQAGVNARLTFVAQGIDNITVDDLKLMTILDTQYNARFTTAVSKREYNSTNPMLDFVEYDLRVIGQNQIELNLRLSADYRDYVGFLTNRESSNYKLPIVGFYLEYSGYQDSLAKQTISQEIALDLRNALKAVPFIQAQSFATVIDDDRILPLSILFSSTQEIAPSDVNVRAEGASSYTIGDVITTWKQLPNEDNKYQYAVTIENPSAIDDEGDAYASVSFGLKSLNLFSTSMVIASNRLMFEHTNDTSVRVSAQRKTALSLGLTNLPFGNYQSVVSVATPDTTDGSVVVDGSVSYVTEERGIATFMFDPVALNTPQRLLVNAALSKDQHAVEASQWLDIQYNSAPFIMAEQTSYNARPGDTVIISVPEFDDADNYTSHLDVSWQKASDAPQFIASSTKVQIQIANNAKENTQYSYTMQVSDGLDTAEQVFTINVTEAPPAGATNTQTNANNTVVAAPASKPTSEQKSGGALGLVSVLMLLPLIYYRRLRKRM